MARYKAINSKTKNICIICEGYEELDYLKHLKALNLWDKTYNIVFKNAKSIDGIARLYQSQYADDTNDLVLVFCDTEMHPHSQFLQMIKTINSFHGKENITFYDKEDIAKYVVFYANPCTMQILIKHFADKKIRVSEKSKNRKLIEDATGIDGYEATEKQRSAIMSKISVANYSSMKKRLKNEDDYAIIGTTNFASLLINLEQSSVKWISQINKKL